MPVTTKRANRLIFFFLTLLGVMGLVVATSGAAALAKNRLKSPLLAPAQTFNAETERRRESPPEALRLCASAFLDTCLVDSSLIYSTYLGGELTDAVQAMAVDDLGRVYVVGTTQSTTFPDAECTASPDHGVDAFVGRFSADGRALDYLFWFNATNAADVDEGLGLAIDAQGSAIVTGHTRSADFCTVFGDVPGYDTAYNGNGDAFVLKVQPDGSGLAYCTFLGGNDWDSGTAVAVDDMGNVTLTGGTWSADFPVTTGAIATEPYGLRDAFLARLDAEGALTYATFYGGGGQEQGEAISLDGERALITGWTNSADLQTTADALRQENNGNFDAFVMILDEDNQLGYATYLGGGDEDRGAAVAIGSGGVVVVGGSTRSLVFGTRPNAAKRGTAALDGFVAGLVPGESRPRYVTFLGGEQDDRVAGLAIDSLGHLFVTGDTQSADFPNSSGAELNGEQDSFLAVLSPLGNLRDSLLLGGSDWERGIAIAIGEEGAVYLGGATRSADFPTTPSAFDTTLNDDYDAYIMKRIMMVPSSNYQLFLPIIRQHS